MPKIPTKQRIEGPKLCEGLKDQVKSVIFDLLKSADFTLLTPKNPAHGDYALFLKPDAGNSKQLIDQLSKCNLFTKVEQNGNFINLNLNPDVLTQEMEKIITQKADYGNLDNLKNQKIVVEFAHPNTHKIFHIGHLRNIILGETLSRILIQSGAEVHRVNYQGDVGLHIAKCLYAILKRKHDLKNLKSLDQKIAFLGSTYTQGTIAYESDEKAKEEIQKINQLIFSKDKQIKSLWQETRSWSLEYFDRIYSHIGTKFDRLFFESEVAQSGLAIAKEALKKGILSESEGAIIFNGKSYGVDTRVFINSFGLPTYEAKELGLAELEFSEFGNINKCIHVVTPEQTSFFKVMFKVEELLNDAKYKGKQMHFAYEFVDLKGGKMSSREGNVVSGDWLLNEVKNKIVRTFNTSESIAETLALAAVKYAFLKIDAGKKIKFDINESISINGNSGPYLLYTYARCKSVLNKEVDNKLKPITTNFNQFQPEEILLLRTFFRLPEVIKDASSKYAPHLVCTYLYDLAQKFSSFYEKCPILKADEQQKQFRLKLTVTTAQILKNGLHLLGIQVLDKI